MGDKVISPYSVETQLEGLSPKEVRSLRMKTAALQQSKGTMLGNPNPGVYEQAMVGKWIDQDSWTGQFVSSFGQFKSFALTMHRVMRHSTIAIPMDNVKSFGDIFKSKNSMRQLARFTASLFVLGYVSESLYDIIENRTPRPLTDPDMVFRSIQSGGHYRR